MADSTQPKISLRDLAGVMLYIGIAGYGGGPAIIAYLKQVVVDRHKWMTEEQYLTGISLSQLLPGATALGVVVYLGYRLRGTLGALIAPICFLFPSMVLMTALSALYFAFGNFPVVRALFIGLGAVVVGLLLNAILVMGRSAIRDIPAGCIAVAIFLLMLWRPIPIPLIVIISAFAGLIIYTRTLGQAEAAEIVPPPRPPVRFWWGSLLALAVVGVLLALTARTTATSLFLALLRVGALTFGGGYTSVPLFQHEAVVVHHWLTNREFLDGLALGQITPGPVLITATFIGYHVLGVLGAVLGTIAVFLPGGLAMFYVAHIHEYVQHLRWLQVMVRGIVAGFIGVLLHVTLQITQQSITDWKTVLIALASAFMLIVLKKDPLWVILGGAVLSLVLFR